MDVTDLPEPDSPTMPSVLPGITSKSTPRTACTTPFSVLKRTLRSRTERTALVGACSPAARRRSAVLWVGVPAVVLLVI